LTYFSLIAVEKHIRRHHPGCPDFAVSRFAEQIALKDWKGATLGKAVGVTMQTFLRHEMTDYDASLLLGMDHQEARRRVQPRINRMVQAWKRKPETCDIQLIAEIADD
jgi:hypothetical protein